ncbi:vWA domain-containing protein [Nonomuraea turcica]|uniref:hypothetical protein n=1 Tax=Nonomuraea sp. G32 TaxID=3067274 RepID=UPI00273C434F|nr:hypothetical protein [Nonomuraea sp. G32]MDP4505946.1 hypothetical protein [Nonomuraea sp. G32]
MNDPGQKEKPDPNFGRSAKEALISALAAAIVGVVLVPWINLFRTLPLHMQLWLPLGIGIVVAALLNIPFLREILQRYEKLVLLFLLGLAGAGLATCGWLAFGALTADDRCPAPKELRLVTAPENVTELTTRTQQYMRENRIDGCPSIRLTVAVAPPPVHLTDAFTNRWEWREDRRDQPYARLYDLQPDAWVATTTAEVDEFRAGGLKSENGSAPEIAVGKDQLVLAMTEQRGEELGKHMDNPDQYSFREVWDTLTKKMGMTIARPFPETSMAALIGTRDVFHGRELPPDNHVQAEQELVANGLGADTVTSLLCEFDALADESQRRRTDPKIALLVPGHSVEDFNAGRVEGCAGTGESTHLIAVRHGHLSPLGYQYVKVTWPGQRSAEREKLIDHFGAWLQKHPLFPNVLESSTIKIDDVWLRQLKTLKKQLLDELRPQLDLRLIVDTSGSADRPVRIQAAEALRANSRMLAPRDRVQVFGLHAQTRNGPAEVTGIAARSDPEQLGSVAVKIENTPFDKWDAPASAGLAQLGAGDEAVPAPVVLLTDGRLFDNEGGGAAATVIARALEDASTVSGLYVVVFGQDQCAVTMLQGTRKPYQCVTAGTSAEEAITRAIITVRGWR